MWNLFTEITFKSFELYFKNISQLIVFFLMAQKIVGKLKSNI